MQPLQQGFGWLLILDMLTLVFIVGDCIIPWI